MTTQPPEFKHGDKVAIHLRDKDYDYGTVIAGYVSIDTPFAPNLYLVQCVKEYFPHNLTALEYIRGLDLEEFDPRYHNPKPDKPKPHKPNSPIHPEDVRQGDIISHTITNNGITTTTQGRVAGLQEIQYPNKDKYYAAVNFDGIIIYRIIQKYPELVDSLTFIERADNENDNT